jgi:hypothetical protein
LQRSRGPADGIQLESPERPLENRRALLVPRAVDLGESIWQLTFESGRPELLINRALGDWRAVARSAAFRAFVLPEVMRQILEQAIDADESDESWEADWLRFAETLSGVGPRPTAGEPGERDLWQLRAVDAFCRQHRFRQLAAAEAGGIGA